MASTGDLLTAASILLAVYGLLYSVWYSEIRSALGIGPRRKRADRDPQIAEVRSTLRARAARLAAGAITVTGTFAFHTAVHPYNAVATTLFLAVVACGLLALHSICMVWGLWRKKRLLEHPDTAGA